MPRLAFLSPFAVSGQRGTKARSYAPCLRSRARSGLIGSHSFGSVSVLFRRRGRVVASGIQSCDPRPSLGTAKLTSSLFSASVPEPKTPPIQCSKLRENTIDIGAVLSNRYSQIVYTAIPLLVSGLIPFSAIAEGEDGSAAAVVDDLTDSFVSEAAKDNSRLSRILGTIVLVLLVYATIGVIVLSINSFIVSQNDKRERAKIQEMIDANPNLKRLSDAKPARGTGTGPNPAVGPGANRQQRRSEKKAKEREEREKKKREKKAAARRPNVDETSKS